MKVCLITMLGVLLLFSCSNSTNDNNEDLFYSELGGLGVKRIPLIKPYEVKNVAIDDWRLELQTTRLLELSIHNVKAVNVSDSVIFVYAKGKVSIKGINHDEGWFVIIPSSEIEEGFTSENEFLAYLCKAGIKFSNLYNVEEVYNLFSKNGKIDWKNMSIVPNALKG